MISECFRAVEARIGRWLEHIVADKRFLIEYRNIGTFDMIVNVVIFISEVVAVPISTARRLLIKTAVDKVVPCRRNVYMRSELRLMHGFGGRCFGSFNSRFGSCFFRYYIGTDSSLDRNCFFDL